LILHTRLNREIDRLHFEFAMHEHREISQIAEFCVSPDLGESQRK